MIAVLVIFRVQRVNAQAEKRRPGRVLLARRDIPDWFLQGRQLVLLSNCCVLHCRNIQILYIAHSIKILNFETILKCVYRIN